MSESFAKYTTIFNIQLNFSSQSMGAIISLSGVLIWKVITWNKTNFNLRFKTSTQNQCDFEIVLVKQTKNILKFLFRLQANQLVRSEVETLAIFPFLNSAFLKKVYVKHEKKRCFIQQTRCYQNWNHGYESMDDEKDFEIHHSETYFGIIFTYMIEMYK